MPHIVFGLLFLSGAAGTAYELIWSRLLALQMGNTAYALATILTVFMAGLCAVRALFGSAAPA